MNKCFLRNFEATNAVKLELTGGRTILRLSSRITTHGDRMAEVGDSRTKVVDCMNQL